MVNWAIEKHKFKYDFFHENRVFIAGKMIIHELKEIIRLQSLKTFSKSLNIF